MWTIYSTSYFNLQYGVYGIACLNIFLAVLLFLPLILSSDFFSFSAPQFAISDSILKTIAFTTVFAGHACAGVALFNAAKIKDLDILWYWMYYSAGEIVIVTLGSIPYGSLFKVSLPVNIGLLVLQALEIYVVFAYTQEVFKEREEQQAAVGAIVAWFQSLFSKD